MLLGMLALAIAATFIGVFATVHVKSDEGTPAPTQSATPSGGGPTISMGDNFFEFQGQRNPTVTAQTGANVSFTLANNGRSIHNMRIAGPDNRYDNADDIVSNPESIRAGQNGSIAFTFGSAGSYNFRCDFHPDDMHGTITVQ
jgi:plastocyanin